MKLIDIIDNYNIELYEVNRSITTPNICGTLLFKGNAELLKNSKHKDQEVFKILEYKHLNKTMVIVF